VVFREAFRGGGGKESILLLGCEGVGGECYRGCQEVESIAASGEHLGEKGTKDCEREGVKSIPSID